jgi:hypothetical protein
LLLFFAESLELCHATIERMHELVNIKTAGFVLQNLQLESLQLSGESLHLAYRFGYLFFEIGIEHI